MKEGWVLYKNNARRPFYPVPSLPYVEKRIERGADPSVVSDKLRGKSSKSKKDKERRRKKRDRKERQHRRDPASAKIEKEGSSDAISISLEKLAVVDDHDYDDLEISAVPLINRNYAHNNSSADLKTEEFTDSKSDHST